MVQAWDQHWDWFQQLPAGAHMFSSNATESYRAEGSLPFDKGHALSAIALPIPRTSRTMALKKKNLSASCPADLANNGVRAVR